MIEHINKALTIALTLAIILTGCFALSLASVHGSITISFGHQPADMRLTALADAVPASALGAR